MALAPPVGALVPAADVVASADPAGVADSGVPELQPMATRTMLRGSSRFIYSRSQMYLVLSVVVVALALMSFVQLVPAASAPGAVFFECPSRKVTIALFV